MAIQERDFHIISLNKSLQESVEMCAELTETEIRLQKELNAQIAASTEEIEALSCTHSESIKVLEESVQRLTAHTEELQKKFSFEQQRWALEGVYDCENYDYSTESKSTEDDDDDDEVEEVVVLVEGEVNMEGEDEEEEEAWAERDNNDDDDVEERSNEGCDFNFDDLAGVDSTLYGSNSGLNDFENTNEIFKTVKPEIRKESRDMRNGNCRLNDSYGSVAERFFEFGNPLLSQKMGNKKRDSLPKLVDRNVPLITTDTTDTVPAPSTAPMSKLQLNWRLAKELKRAKAAKEESANTLATTVSERKYIFYCYIYHYYY